MITAKDLYKHIKDREDTVSYEHEIEIWLHDIVFPTFKGNSCKFIKPKNIPLDYLMYSLQTRGFSVVSNTERHIGADWFVTLTIPPQGTGLCLSK